MAYWCFRRIKRLLTCKNEVNILGFSVPPADYNQMVAQAGNTAGKTRIIHVVQPGEFTHKIAMQYNVTLENIRPGISSMVTG